MFADPQALTVSGTAVSLPRVGSGNPSRLGVYQNADGSMNLSIRQDQTANRFRREVRLTMKKVAADPISAVNKEVSASVIIAIDEPKVGFTDVELTSLYTALTAALSASSNARLLQLMGGEL